MSDHHLDDWRGEQIYYLYLHDTRLCSPAR